MLTHVGYGCLSLLLIAAVGHGVRSQLSITTVDHGFRSRLSIASVGHGCLSRLSIMPVGYDYRSQLLVTAVSHGCLSRLLPWWMVTSLGHNGCRSSWSSRFLVTDVNHVWPRLFGSAVPGDGPGTLPFRRGPLPPRCRRASPWGGPRRRRPVITTLLIHLIRDMHDTLYGRHDPPPPLPCS